MWAASSQLSLLSLPWSRSRHRDHLGTPTFSTLSDPESLVSPKQDSASSHSPDLIPHWSPEPAFQSNVPWVTASLVCYTFSCPLGFQSSLSKMALWAAQRSPPPHDTADYSSPVPPLGPTGPSPLSAVALTPQARGPFVAVLHPAPRAPGEPATALR